VWLNLPLSDAQGDSGKMLGLYLSECVWDRSKMIPWALLLDQAGSNAECPAVSQDQECESV